MEVAQGGGTLRLVLHFQWQVRRGSHNATALRARPPAATRPHTCVCIYARTPAHFCTITYPRRTEVDSRRRAASTTCGIPRVHRPRASTTHEQLCGREKQKEGRRKKEKKKGGGKKEERRNTIIARSMINHDHLPSSLSTRRRMCRDECGSSYHHGTWTVSCDTCSSYNICQVLRFLTKRTM